MMIWDKSVKLCVRAALALSVSLPAFAAPDIKTRLLSSAPADTSFQSCKTLIQCVDILERHGIDSFDYSILARDFDRFGDKSREVLWRIIDAGMSGEHDDEILANRALDMLSRSPNILPPVEQRRITELWANTSGTPYRPEFLARIMLTNLSPMVRSTAVRTLDHKNPDIAFLSRSILSQTLQRQMKFPMPEADFVPLSRAILSTPSPTLIDLIALYPAKTSAPVLARALKSGDIPTVISAYGALYKDDPEAAFKALVGTLYELKPSEAKAATALGGLLAHRHPMREDGFYMTFASELSADPEMSEAGRAAGFSALLLRQGEKGVADLSDTPLTREGYALALSAFTDGTIPSVYFDVPQMMGGQSADVWLRPLSETITTSQDKLALTEVAGNFDTPLARDIAARAMAAQDDYRLTVAGILATTAQANQNDETLTRSLAAMTRSNPFSLVRAAADLGIRALKNKSPRKTIFALQSKLPSIADEATRDNVFCKIESTNIRQIARAMPYYDDAVLPRRTAASRGWLTSGARAKQGWLAGYSRPKDGGLVSYNNVSQQGVELFGDSPFGPQAVIAVIPTTQVPLGQTASAFWVFSTALTTNESAIYHAKQKHNGDFLLTHHLVLPAQPTAIRLGSRAEITFAMGTVNPPLTLTSNGMLRRACAPEKRLEKTPS